jgi:phage baseplate assembly protein V
MVGVIAALDEAAARVRVNADGMLTDWLPFTASRAGPGVRVWAAPEVGEQVVLVSPYGDPAQAVVLGSVYQDAYGAPASNKFAARTEFADGASIQYDRAGHLYEIDVPAGGVITLRIGRTTLVMRDGSTTLTTPELVVDSPKSTFTGPVSVAGNITVTGGDVIADGIGLKTHKHPGVQTGSGSTSPPVA